MDYDLEGNYIRMWVPELKEIPGSKIHSPWMLSSGALSAAKIRLGDNYPNPVVVAPEWSRHQKGGKVCFFIYLVCARQIQNMFNHLGLRPRKSKRRESARD